MSSIFGYNSYNSYSNYNAYSSYNSSSNLLTNSSRNTNTNYYNSLIQQYGNKTDVSTSQPYQVKQQGEDLSNLLSKLTSKNSTSDVNKLLAKSSNTKEVQFDNSKSVANSKSANFTVQVGQVAKAQVNSDDSLKLQATGKTLSASTKNDPYMFDITVGGKSRTFSIDVTDKDNNSTVQSKIASAINNANIGVTASVEKKDGVTKLSVAGKTTGTGKDSGFTIADRNGSLADAMGITKKSQAAQNAEYKIGNADGTSFSETKTSTSNTIDVGNGVKAELKAATTEPVKATFGRDTATSVTAAKDIVNALNDTLQSLKDVSGRGSNRLFSDITGMNKNYSASLSRVGINVNSNGTLSVDEKKLTEAAGNGKLQSLFQDNGGFAKRAANIGSNMKSGSFYANPATASYKNTSSTFGSYGNNSYSLINMLM